MRSQKKRNEGASPNSQAPCHPVTGNRILSHLETWLTPPSKRGSFQRVSNGIQGHIGIRLRIQARYRSIIPHAQLVKMNACQLRSSSDSMPCQ